MSDRRRVVIEHEGIATGIVCGVLLVCLMAPCLVAPLNCAYDGLSPELKAAIKGPGVTVNVNEPATRPAAARPPQANAHD